MRKASLWWKLLCVLIGVMLAFATNAYGSSKSSYQTSKNSAKLKQTVNQMNSQAPDEILVKLKPGKSINETNLLLGGKTIGKYYQSGVVRVKLPPGTSLSSALRMYSLNPGVEYAEPNYIRKVYATPNDPYLSNQWAIDRISARQAWDFTEGDPSVVIAVIDSGIDINHPELKGKIYKPYNSVLKSTNPSDVLDDVGHGTHVSGIAAAAINNGTGIAGVAGKVDIMPVKAGDNGEFYDSDIADAIDYAVNNGARVINLSLGGTGTSATLENAVNYALSHNVVVVAAAGNDASSVPCYPAAYSGVVGVAATDESDTDASFSNYGSYINVSAPGTNIFSTTPTYPITSSDPPALNYDYMSGTSMASPEVAGLAGLVLSAKPSLTSQQVKNLIDNNTDDIDDPGWDPFTGYGRINAYKTLEAETAPVMVTSTVPANQASNVDSKSNIVVNFNKNISQGAAYNNIKLLDSNNNVVAVSQAINGQTLTISPINGLSYNTAYTLVIPVNALNDSYGNTVVTAYSLKFSTGQSDLLPPTVVSSDPVTDAQSVPVNKLITIGFSELIQAGNSFGTITLQDNLGNSVPISTSISGNNLTLKPTANLQNNTKYTVIVPAASIEDLSRNPLAATFYASFTTADVIPLSFNITKAVMDPTKPIVYITDKSAYKLYAVNYSTGVVSSISFAQMPESLAIGKGQYADELYVALLSQEHSSYVNLANQSGVIDVIDLNNFTIKDNIPVAIDPFDIVPGRDGKLYIPSGSGQWTQIQSYDRVTKQQVGYADIYERSYGELHPTLDRIYTIDTTVSPRDYNAYNISGGTFTDPVYPGGYDSPYHGDYPLATNFAIDPTGKYLFNGSGVIFSTTTAQSTDMNYVRTLNTGFSDIAFDPDLSKFYTLPTNKKSIYVYNASDFSGLGTVQLTNYGKYLFVQNGKLIALTSNNATPSNYYIEVLPGVNPVPDTTPPRLNVSLPQDNYLTNQSSVNVSGNTEIGSVVKVNGIPVTVGTFGDFSVTVNLTSGINTITITSSDNAGNTTTVTRKVTYDNVPPTLSINGPADNLLTNQQQVSVNGQTEAGSTLKVNGQTIPVNGDGTFNTAVTLNSNGTNVITVTATDAAGNITTVTRNVVYDNIPPAVQITSPVNNLRTNQQQVSVAGQTEVGSVVKVNGATVNVGSNGSFNSVVPLNTGTNTISITATDKARNTTTVTRTVVYDNTPPVLTVSTPTDNSKTTKVSSTVTGQTEAGSVVTVNGVSVSVGSNGSFSSSVHLVPGTNKITVIATDPAGNSTSVVRSVECDYIPLTLTITSPVNNLETIEGQVSVTGNTAPGAEVRINGMAVSVDSGGNFNAIAGLVSGNNVLTITAKDDTGSTLTHTLNVLRSQNIEDTSKAIALTGNWSSFNTSSNSGGSAVYSSDANAAVTMNFTGASVKLVGYKAVYYGIADVYIDGSKAGSIDYYSASTQYQQTLFTASGLTSGTHSLKLVWTGRKNALASSTNINLDYVLVN